MLKRLSLSVYLFCYSTLGLTCQDNQVKIITSSSKRYQVGACLGPQTKLHLGPNEKLVLQPFKNGKAFGRAESVAGKYDDEDSIKKNLGTFIQMILGILGKRAGGKSPFLWKIDVEHDEHFCFDASTTKTLIFWREEADETIRFTLTKEYESNWLLKEHELSWPTEIPIQTDQEYLFKINDRPRMLTLHTFPPALSKIQKVMWMRKQSCLRQADLFSKETL